MIAGEEPVDSIHCRSYNYAVVVHFSFINNYIVDRNRGSRGIMFNDMMTTMLVQSTVLILR